MGLVLAQYNALVKARKIQKDQAQIALIAKFDRLLDEVNRKKLAKKASPLGWLFGKKQKKENLHGLYIYGNVGRGKTMLMDLFYNYIDDPLKKRAHFNDFMADVHRRINQHRQDLKAGKTKENDPIPVVAKSLSDEAHILCFDEFTVTDIADAMVLSRLFNALFQQGVTLVATSNVEPDNLYMHGINRQLFIPFIKTLKQNVDVINLDAKTDYRLEKNNQLSTYLTPLNKENHDKMEEVWLEVTQGKQVQEIMLNVRGHGLHIPQAVEKNARFDFKDLCQKPLAANDYLALLAQYHTIFLENVPIMGDENRNEAKRFILLIDCLYDRHARLFISAEAKAEKLYQGRAKTTETFEFERTASRLFEMQSQEYLNIFAQKH